MGVQGCDRNLNIEDVLGCEAGHSSRTNVVNPKCRRPNSAAQGFGDVAKLCFPSRLIIDNLNHASTQSSMVPFQLVVAIVGKNRSLTKIDPPCFARTAQSTAHTGSPTTRSGRFAGHA